MATLSQQRDGALQPEPVGGRQEATDGREERPVRLVEVNGQHFLFREERRKASRGTHVGCCEAVGPDTHRGICEEGGLPRGGGNEEVFSLQLEGLNQTRWGSEG